MKRKILLLLTFTVYLVSAQNVSLSWFKNYGGTSYDTGKTVRKVPNNGYIICGNTESNNFDIINNHGDQDIFLMKLDENRNIVWQRSYGGSARDGIDGSNSLQITSDGGYIFTGTTNSNDGDVIRPSSSYNSIWVVKVNSVGNIEWQKIMGTSNSSFYASSVNVLNDGNVVVSGYSGNTALLSKLDANGNLIWQKTFAGVNYSTNIYDTKVHNNGFILIGHDNFGSFVLTSKIRIINVDTNGNLIWDKNYVYSNADRNYSRAVIADPDGTFVISGICGVYAGYSGVIAKLDALGNTMWENAFTNPGWVDINSGIINQNNEYVFCGYKRPTTFGIEAFYIARFNSNGTKTGENIIQGNSTNILQNIIEEGNNEYVAVGGSQASYLTSPFPLQISGRGGFDIVLLKVTGIANLSTHDVLPEKSEIKIYPNPASSIVQIKSKKSIVGVKVFSAEGKLVMHKKAKDIQSIDISEIPSGVYSCEFMDADQLKIYEKIIKK